MAGRAPRDSRPAAATAGDRNRGRPAGRSASRRQRTPGPGGPADPARSAAFAVLCAVTSRGAYANLLLAALLAERGLAGRDAALATELTYGTLRGQGSYDAILAACADRAPARMDPPVLDALRLGAHQLLSMRVPPHAAVATTVSLARGAAGQRASGFVNAVLRRVAQRDLSAWLDIVAPDRSGDPIGHLAVRYSHPPWIVSALADALGEPASGSLAETEQALAADNARPQVTLCAMPGACDAAELAAAGAAPARWSEFGAYLDRGDPGGIAAVAQGRAAIEDEASQLAAVALARVSVPGRDALWLDMCAGPGGKARLLAGLAATRPARLLAADRRPHRAALAGAAVSAGPAAAVAADGTRPPWLPGSFDRVLADVPCTGLGALRRRPEARWRRGPADVAELARLQRSLLGSALAAARPGGVVAYVTCSPHLAETRAVVAAMLAARPGDAELLDAPAVLSEVPGLLAGGQEQRYAQFWPHRHGTDAIFLALLRRTAGAPA
ncbi:MAG TPA: RsmB/NOP family class I SAM-dependent RNA methyltransferase [Streptosporangiaceae bacterium]